MSLCKMPYGLAEPVEALPLKVSHLPTTDPSATPVSIVSLKHLSGVNALATNQQLDFGPALTVVYGPNAAGKSGYTRILKRACNARGAETILSNVLVDEIPERPNATITYSIGSDEQIENWTDGVDGPAALGRISVFDRYCAAVYLSQKTDVAFRPFGLDLFDRLALACGAVKRLLEREKRDLAADAHRIPPVHDETEVGGILRTLSSLSDVERVKKLARFGLKESDNLATLRMRAAELLAGDPEKIAASLELRSSRLAKLAEQLQTTTEVLRKESLSGLMKSAKAVDDARREAEKLRQQTLAAGLLPGTGSPDWKALWIAAEGYSEAGAYEGHEFPFIEEAARCVLCQQELGEEAKVRLRQFSEFLNSKAEKKVSELSQQYQSVRQRFEDLRKGGLVSPELVEDLKVEAEAMGNDIEAAVLAASNNLSEILESRYHASSAKREIILEDYAQSVKEIAASLQDRAGELRSTDRAAKVSARTQQIRELEASEALAKNLSSVLSEIDRLKRLAAYKLCLEDTNTYSITRKSTEVTKAVVTDSLAASFQAELSALGFTHVEVALEPIGGEKGALYHQVVLTRAKDTSLAHVLSEGEARCLTIAAFFSELSTAVDPSAILFDDPVSSLDHEWRGNVALRLADEAARRQVVVFTHDIVFLLALTEAANHNGVAIQHQYIKRERQEPGVASEDLPWIAMSLKDRIGVLRRLHQAADNIFRTRTQAEYEKEASHIYGLLREAWERGVEEVLIGGVVERYRKSIQTLQVGMLADITEQDCEELEQGMSKSSRWLSGHDQASAENVAMPNPAELSQDIESLATWRKRIIARRN